MKKILTIPTLILALALSISAATPQQPMSAEKKSAMHKLDPVDIFPQVQERSGKDRNRNNRSSNSASANLANNSSKTEPRANSRRNSRRRHPSEEKLPTDLAANSTPTPTIAAQSAGSEPAASPTATPDSIVAVGETANNRTAQPPQTLAAIGNPPGSSDGNRNPLLSLPIILALLVLVLIVLVLVFAKLIRYLRGPVA